MTDDEYHMDRAIIKWRQTVAKSEAHSLCTTVREAADAVIQMLIQGEAALTYAMMGGLSHEKN